MCGTTLEVAMLADVSGAYSTISSVWLGPSDINLRHSLWMNLTLIGQQKVNGMPLNLDDL